MRKRFLAAAALYAGLSIATAEPLSVPPQTAAAPAAGLPARGTDQTAVLQAFGTPVTRHAPVGGGHPRQPPITRWDYPGYSVFFEHDKVIDVVVRDAPPPIRHVDELQPQP